jgi:hypothetical protein
LKNLVCLLVACVMACVSESTPVTPNECGEAPGVPGFAVSFEEVNGSSRALLLPADWQRVQRYLDETAAWAACVQDVP